MERGERQYVKCYKCKQQVLYSCYQIHRFRCGEQQQTEEQIPNLIPIKKKANGLDYRKSKVYHETFPQIQQSKPNKPKQLKPCKKNQRTRNNRQQQLQLIACIFCGYQQTFQELDTHPKQCKHRIQKCRQCSLQLPLNLMTDHVRQNHGNQRNNRNERQQYIKCIRCNENITTRQYQRHGQHCEYRLRYPQNISRNSMQRTFQQMQHVYPLPNQSQRPRTTQQERQNTRIRMNNRLRLNPQNSNPRQNQNRFQSWQDDQQFLNESQRNRNNQGNTRNIIMNLLGLNVSNVNGRQAIIQQFLQRLYHHHHHHHQHRHNSSQRNSHGQGQEDESPQVATTISSGRNTEWFNFFISQIAQFTRYENSHEHGHSHRHENSYQNIEEDPIGLTEQEISRLKKIRYETKSENDLCSICYTQFKDKQKITELKCKHIYHSQCINQWIKKNDKCPVCKRSQKN